MRRNFRYVATLVAMIAGLGTAACSDSSGPDDEDIPRVIFLDAASAPTPPAGTVATCYANTDGVTTSPTCPVIRWRDVTYWVFAYIDGRLSMNLGAYDEDDNLIDAQELENARNLYQITVTANQQIVTLYGAGASTITVPWSVLEASQPGEGG